jgi:hypothetical protein
MQKTAHPHSSWQELVASPQRPSHIVQIYDSDDFLVAGVGLFAAEGLSRGEAVLLTGTAAHLDGVRIALRSHGIDVDAALARGQLACADVHEGIVAVMQNGKVDATRFRAVAGAALAEASAAARYSGVRWWGEMSNVLHHSGDDKSALDAERLADATAREQGCTIFCSYLLDRFDRRGYDGMLREVCSCHSHVIPAEDYVRHRLAVNRAIAEVIGDIKGTLLQSLLSWQGLGCDLPSSQALLFWLRDALPERLDEVLERARSYQLQESHG